MTVFLVRHADAKSRANWEANDALRPLSKKGEAQASGLVDQLEGANITRVLSSPAVRCTTTVEPLAEKYGRKVEETDVLLEGADAATAYELLCRVAREAGDAVVCTHGDLVPELLRIAARDGVSLEDEARWAKGSTWALEADGDGITRARYLPPPGER